MSVFIVISGESGRSAWPVSRSAAAAQAAGRAAGPGEMAAGGRHTMAWRPGLYALVWGTPRADALSPGGGRLAQRESASFTPRRSLVRSQYRPRSSAASSEHGAGRF